MLGDLKKSSGSCSSCSGEHRGFERRGRKGFTFSIAVVRNLFVGGTSTFDGVDIVMTSKVWGTVIGGRGVCVLCAEGVADCFDAFDFMHWNSLLNDCKMPASLSKIQ